MHAKDTNKVSEGVLLFPVIGVVRVTQCVFTWSKQKFQGGLADMNSCPFKEKRQEAQSCQSLCIVSEYIPELSHEFIAQSVAIASAGFCIEGAEQPFCPQTAQNSSPLYLFLG